jgi:hypothetical protein
MKRGVSRAMKTKIDYTEVKRLHDGTWIVAVIEKNSLYVVVLIMLAQIEEA